MNTDDDLIASALAAARDTKQLLMGQDALQQTPLVFRRQFGDRPAVIVADSRTFHAAGARLRDAFNMAGHASLDPLIFDDPNFHAEHRFVERLEDALKQTDAIPIAVGSGTINDITKLAAHRTGRAYMCVATAASMDGYTAYGASITHEGSKQTFDCPAPRAVVADLDVIAAAPAQMNAWGYADLLAKITAGADWIIADELGVEPIDPRAWRMVQERLRDWVGKPDAVRRGDPDALRSLVCGLMMSGFAMQATQTSRVASGAEHQFSHLWDMEQATDASHGAKVGVATVAVAQFYEALSALTLSSRGTPRDRADLPRGAGSLGVPRDDKGMKIDELFQDHPEIAAKAKSETANKHWNDGIFDMLRDRWPRLQRRLREHLPPARQLARMLQSAGAPTEPQQIGISKKHLHDSFLRAYHIRRRFTILDLAVRTGMLESCLREMEDADVGS